MTELLDGEERGPVFWASKVLDGTVHFGISESFEAFHGPDVTRAGRLYLSACSALPRDVAAEHPEVDQVYSMLLAGDWFDERLRAADFDGADIFDAFLVEHRARHLIEALGELEPLFAHSPAGWTLILLVAQAAKEMRGHALDGLKLLPARSAGDTHNRT